MLTEKTTLPSGDEGSGESTKTAEQIKSEAKIELNDSIKNLDYTIGTLMNVRQWMQSQLTNM